MSDTKKTTRREPNQSKSKIRDVPKGFKKMYGKLCRHSAHRKPTTEKSGYVKYPEGWL